MMLNPLDRFEASGASEQVSEWCGVGDGLFSYTLTGYNIVLVPRFLAKSFTVDFLSISRNIFQSLASNGFDKM